MKELKGARLAVQYPASLKDQVKNWVTLAGVVEIGRLPGLVTVTMTVPTSKLEQSGIAHLVKEQYI